MVHHHDELSLQAQSFLDILANLSPEELDELESRIADLIEAHDHATHNQRE